MSRHSHADLFCDECGNWVVGATDLSIRAMRQMARELGWVVDRSTTPPRDLCNRCKP